MNHLITEIAKDIYTQLLTQHKNHVQACTTTFIADWLFRHNHKANREKEIPGICITLNAIESCMDIPECLGAGERSLVILDNEYLGMISGYVLCGWL